MEIKNLCFSYEGKKPYLIEDLSFNVEKGMFLSVLGENGSAKSTLIRVILGLLKPVEGEIIQDFKNIGYVPQKKDNFNMKFPITVEELLNIHIKTTKTKPMTVNEVLELVNMAEYKKSLFGSLSGGQQQRILIARALSSNPDLIIFDEPLTGIDEASQKFIRDILLKLNKKGLTIISIEHDISFAIHNSSHILTMKEGNGTLYSKEEYLKKINHIENHGDYDNFLYHEEVHNHA